MISFRTLVVATALSIACLACAQDDTDVPVSADDKRVKPSATVIRNVRVQIGDGQSALDAQDIRFEQGKITAIGPTGSVDAGPGTDILDYTGHTVLPGFVGLHNHLHMPGAHLMAETAPRLYLAGGVTTLFTAGAADATGELALTDRIASGQQPGPTIIPSAPYITGPEGTAVMAQPRTLDEARDFVETWADRGVGGFKLYRHVEPDIAAAVIEAAHVRGLTVTGHLCSLTFADAAALGIDRVEHGFNSATDFVPDKPFGECVPSKTSKVDLDLNDPRVTDLIDTMVSKGVALTSTLAIMESHYPHRQQGSDRDLRALTPERVTAYQARQARLQASANTTSNTPHYWQKVLGFERAFVAAGGRLVAGPDTGRHVLPGYGDQRNFELLVEAGFSVPETVQIMSHNGALELSLGQTIGLIRVGYEADMIIVEGNLDATPNTIRSPVSVIKDGVIYDPSALITPTNGRVGAN